MKAAQMISAWIEIIWLKTLADPTQIPIRRETTLCRNVCDFLSSLEEKDLWYSNVDLSFQVYNKICHKS